MDGQCAAGEVSRRQGIQMKADPPPKSSLNGSESSLESGEHMEDQPEMCEDCTTKQSSNALNSSSIQEELAAHIDHMKNCLALIDHKFSSVGLRKCCCGKMYVMFSLFFQKMKECLIDFKYNMTEKASHV
jgi:hypothetical protein